MNQEEIIITTARRVTKNTGVLLASTVISKLCSLAFFAMAARYLGAAGFGKYTFVLSFTAIFIVLGDLGLSTIAIREVAKDKSLINKYLGNIAILKTMLSAAAVGIIFLIITLLNYPLDTTRIVYIIGISVFFSSLSKALRWCFQAFQKMEYEALVNVIQGIILLGLGVAVLHLGKGLIGLASAHLSTSIIIFCFSFLITVKRFAKPKFEINWDFWQYLIKAAFPVGLMTIFTALYLNTDTVMLSLMKGDAPVGWYNAGYKLVTAVKFIPGMFILAIFPVMSDFYRSSLKSLIRVLKKSIQYMLLLALPLALGVTILAYRFIPLIWGAGFSKAIPALQILIWAGALVFINSVMGYALIAMERQKIPTYISAGGLIINIILNLLLIPRLSHIGASIAILTAEGIVTGIVIFFIFRTLQINPFPKESPKILLAALLMAVFIWFIKGQNLVLIVTSALMLYFGILLLLKGISRGDLRLIKQVIIRR